jgi:hypothetical protein
MIPVYRCVFFYLAEQAAFRESRTSSLGCRPAFFDFPTLVVQVLHRVDLTEDELRARIESKIVRGALSGELPQHLFGGPSAGHWCWACDEAIAAGEAEIEVVRRDTPSEYFHARCHNLLRIAREQLKSRARPSTLS